jgi:hypothetical protein
VENHPAGDINRTHSVGERKLPARVFVPIRAPSSLRLFPIPPPAAPVESLLYGEIAFPTQQIQSEASRCAAPYRIVL